MPQDAWQERLNQALNAYDATPHLLQRFESTTVETLERLDSSTCEITPFKARTRLCPYYLVINDEPVLAGVLATSCPSDKKLIHGMRDAILAPCWVPD
jgi:hypothetical protein